MGHAFQWILTRFLGKTTVARLYAQFLESIQALPGNAFEETTGSQLSFEGVQGAQKMIDNALKAGGGAIFIDEAYQLVSEHDPSGKQVLDFLLGEMENRLEHSYSSSPATARRWRSSSNTIQACRVEFPINSSLRITRTKSCCPCSKIWSSSATMVR